MARADGSTRYPRSRLEKLNIGGDARVLLIDLDDPAFEAEVRERTPHVIVGQTRRKGFTVIIVRLESLVDLDRLERLRGWIAPNGAIWALWRKGRAELKEDHVRRAAVAQGLVDVKVLAFSEQLSALKLVIPVAQRPGGGRPSRHA